MRNVTDIVLVNEDFGFLVHLLHSYNKLYVVRFAHFLSEKNKKKLESLREKKHTKDVEPAVGGTHVYEYIGNPDDEEVYESPYVTEMVKRV